VGETLGEALSLASESTRFGLRLLDRRERETFLTWQEVHARASGVAAGLQGLGIAPGQRVALIFPTGPDFFSAFFGALLAGAVPVPLYPPVRLGRMDAYHVRTARMLAAAGAKLVLADARVRRVLGPTLEASGLRAHGVGALPQGTLRPVHTPPSALGLVQFSSGTTVDPKPVALSHRALLAQTRTLLDGIFSVRDEGDVPRAGCSWLPLYHDMGLVGCVFPALVAVRDLTLLPPEAFVAKPALWLRALSRSRAVVSPAPNFAYALCVERVRDDELDGVDLSHWRMALNGAEPVAPATLRAFVQRFAPWGLRPEALTPVYGLSEAALAVSFSAPDQPFVATRFDREQLSLGTAEPDPNGVELVSVGAPLPGFEIEVRGEQGTLPPDRTGRVWARGPSLMEGYLGRDEATRRALVDGWLDTGDVGFLHDDQLYLTGRAKDLLILRGRNHAPHEVEQAVDHVAGVRTGCAAAASFLPEGADHEALLVFVEHARDATEDERDAMPGLAAEAILRRTSLRPDAVLVLPPGTLPRTSSGKIRRGEALRRHLAGELTSPGAVTPLLIAGVFAKSAAAYARAWARRR